MTTDPKTISRIQDLLILFAGRSVLAPRAIRSGGSLSVSTVKGKELWSWLLPDGRHLTLWAGPAQDLLRTLLLHLSKYRPASDTDFWEVTKQVLEIGLDATALIYNVATLDVIGTIDASLDLVEDTKSMRDVNTHPSGKQTSLPKLSDTQTRLLRAAWDSLARAYPRPDALRILGERAGDKLSGPALTAIDAWLDRLTLPAAAKAQVRAAALLRLL